MMYQSIAQGGVYRLATHFKLHLCIDRTLTTLTVVNNFKAMMKSYNSEVAASRTKTASEWTVEVWERIHNMEGFFGSSGDDVQFVER